MEIRSSGSVLWRGVEIDHHSYNEDQEEKQQAALNDLEYRCRHLEKLGVPVKCVTAIWCWDWFEDMTPDEPLKEFLAQTPCFYQEGMTQELHDMRVAANVPGIPGGWNEEFAPTGRIGWVLNERFYIWDGDTVTDSGFNPSEFDGWYHVLKTKGWFLADCGQRRSLGTIYATLAGIRDFLTRHGFKS
jgi:hypothetical protein